MNGDIFSNDLKTRGLSKNDRLRKRKDFLRLQRRGTRAFSSTIVVIGRKAPHGEQGRVGLTVPKKVGKAHVRNLIKRRFRHLLRENRSVFVRHDIILLALPKASSVDFQTLKEDLLRATRSLNKKFAVRKFRPTPKNAR